MYKLLSSSELQRITEQIATLETFAPDGRPGSARIPPLTLTQESLATGGPEVADKMLSKAFGEQAAKVLLDQVMLAREETGAKF